jgi:hypothetical protein
VREPVSFVRTRGDVSWWSRRKFVLDEHGKRRSRRSSLAAATTGERGDEGGYEKRTNPAHSDRIISRVQRQPGA